MLHTVIASMEELVRSIDKLYGQYVLTLTVCALGKPLDTITQDSCAFHDVSQLKSCKNFSHVQ